MSGSRCDGEGNLYIRKYATDRPMLSPVVKINPAGKRVALFDPVAFSDPKLDRADAFSPAPDGGLYQTASTGGLRPQVYVIRFSADGSPASAARLTPYPGGSEPGVPAAGTELEPFQFAAFPDGNLLVSGFQRDVRSVGPSEPKSGPPRNPYEPDSARSFTAVFTDDGRMLAQLSFEPQAPVEKAGKGRTKPSTASSKPTLDLSGAEAGADGNIYALRRSSSALVYVISPAGKILRTLKVTSPTPGVMPNAFHVSGNRVAISFWNGENRSQILVVTDAQTGGEIAAYADPGSLGPEFACYSADEGVFTFLNLGEGNTLEVIRAEAQ